MSQLGGDYTPFNSSPLKEFIKQSIALLIVIAVVTFWVRGAFAAIKRHSKVCPVCHQVYYPPQQ